MRTQIAALFLIAATSFAAPKESVTLDVQTKQVVNPLVIWPTGTTIECDGCTKIGFGSTGGGVWGSITGTLSDQTDLQSALDSKFTNSVSTSRLLGRLSAGTGTVEEISISSRLQFLTGNLDINQSGDFIWLGAHAWVRNSATSNDIGINTQFIEQYSGGTPSNGFGGYMQFGLESGAGSLNRNAARLAWLWTDVSDSTRTSAVEIWGVNSASDARIARFFSSGSVAVGGSTSDPGAGVIRADIGFNLGGSEFPASSNGFIERTGANTYQASQLPHSVTLVVDGGGIVLGSGTKNQTKIAYGGTLQGWLVAAKPSGSVTIDILRSADGAGLPVTSIVGSGTKPNVTNNVENSSTDFTSWTSTVLTAKDNLAVSLSGIATATYVQVTLYYK